MLCGPFDFIPVLWAKGTNRKAGDIDVVVCLKDFKDKRLLPGLTFFRKPFIRFCSYPSGCHDSARVGEQGKPDLASLPGRGKVITAN